MERIKNDIYSMFDEDYGYDKEHYADIDEFIEYNYKRTLISKNIGDVLFKKLGVDTPFKTYEIFNYVRESSKETDCDDEIAYVNITNNFRYFMAIEWKKEKRIKGLIN